MEAQDFTMGALQAIPTLGVALSSAEFAADSGELTTTPLSWEVVNSVELGDVGVVSREFLAWAGSKVGVVEEVVGVVFDMLLVLCC